MIEKKAYQELEYIRTLSNLLLLKYLLGFPFRSSSN